MSNHRARMADLKARLDAIEQRERLADTPLVVLCAPHGSDEQREVGVYRDGNTPVVVFEGADPPQDVLNRLCGPHTLVIRCGPHVVPVPDELPWNESSD